METRRVVGLPWQLSTRPARQTTTAGQRLSNGGGGRSADETARNEAKIPRETFEDGRLASEVRGCDSAGPLRREPTSSQTPLAPLTALLRWPIER
jgi:hypothetical protein